MNTRSYFDKFEYEKHNVTYNLEWKYLTYLINKNDFYNVNDIKKMKLDKVSLYSLTPFHLSLKIINIIQLHFDDLGEITLTDACACIGGDTINFLNNFKHVNTIELSKLRYNFLCFNLNLFTNKNYKTYNDDCLEIIPDLQQDIVYYDLPWDGRKYKQKKSVKLNLNDLDSSVICNNTIKYCKMICFKIPYNFDIDDFTKNTNFKFLQVYDLKKFKILIMFNKID